LIREKIEFSLRAWKEDKRIEDKEKLEESINNSLEKR
jgi:hypothetical protein